MGNALGLQDCPPRLQVRRLDVGDQPPLEAGAQPVFQRRHGLGRPVAGQHHLPAGLVQGVEGVKELFLGAGLARQKLHIVHQQHIAGAVFGAKLLLGVGADGRHQLVGEHLAGDVDRLVAILAAAVGDGVHQMRLAQADAAVDEERIVAAPRPVAHGHRGGMGQQVVGADDEGVEGVGGHQRQPLVGAVAVERRGGQPGIGRQRCLQQRRRRRLLRLAQRVGLDAVLDLDLALKDVAQRVLDHPVQPQIEPILDKTVGNGDQKGAVLVGHEAGGVQIHLIDVWCHLKLTLAKSCLPGLLRTDQGRVE